MQKHATRGFKHKGCKSSQGQQVLGRAGSLLPDLRAVHEGGGGAAGRDGWQAADWGTGPSQAIVCGAVITGHHKHLQNTHKGQLACQVSEEKEEDLYMLYPANKADHKVPHGSNDYLSINISLQLRERQ